MAVGVSGERAKEVIGEGWARILCVAFTVEDDWVIAEKTSAAVRSECEHLSYTYRCRGILDIHPRYQ